MMEARTSPWFHILWEFLKSLAMEVFTNSPFNHCKHKAPLEGGHDYSKCLQYSVVILSGSNARAEYWENVGSLKLEPESKLFYKLRCDLVMDKRSAWIFFPTVDFP